MGQLGIIKNFKYDAVDGPKVSGAGQRGKEGTNLRKKNDLKEGCSGLQNARRKGNKTFTTSKCW